MRKMFLVSTAAITACIIGMTPAIAADDHRSKGHRNGDGRHEVRSLPHRSSEIRVRGRPYYYSEGRYYEPRGHSYFIVNAPIGARVHRLPSNYVSFGYGANRYYYTDTTYYLWNDRSREYVVVEKPRGAEAALLANTEIAQAAELYVYPRNGQSEEQRDQDRYECHRWAKSQTNYDPSLGGQKSDLAPDYRRAISACLEGREYTVK